MYPGDYIYDVDYTDGEFNTSDSALWSIDAGQLLFSSESEYAVTVHHQAVFHIEDVGIDGFDWRGVSAMVGPSATATQGGQTIAFAWGGTPTAITFVTYNIVWIGVIGGGLVGTGGLSHEIANLAAADPIHLYEAFTHAIAFPVGPAEATVSPIT
jgi:hypothetical protein